MKSVKCLWQILDASQWKERQFEPINKPCSKVLLVDVFKAISRSRAGGSRCLLNLELQVRGLITTISHQPDDGSVAPARLALKALYALSSGIRILIGWR